MMLRKVLVVDDEPDFCEALGDYLETKGYSVLKAYDGDQALDLYQQERPEVVLLDVRMPGKDGIETLRELRVFDPEARVIMVTAVQEEALDRQAATEVDEGTLDYITKPFGNESLERTLSILVRMGLLGGDE
ncbi:MAG: response regulator transcription factor [Dehalococcoidia bacterium]